MKKSITIYDECGETTSELKMKAKNGKKIFKLINGVGFYKKGKTRLKLTKHETFDDDDTIIVENDKFIIEMDFLTLCDLKDILTHVDDIKGNNWFGKTKVLK